MHDTKFFRTTLSFRAVRYDVPPRHACFLRGLRTQAPASCVRRLDEGRSLEEFSGEIGTQTVSPCAEEGDGLCCTVATLPGRAGPSSRDPRSRKPDRRLLFLNAGCSSMGGGPSRTWDRPLPVNNDVICVRRPPSRDPPSAICGDERGGSISDTVVN